MCTLAALMMLFALLSTACDQTKTQDAAKTARQPRIKPMPTPIQLVIPKAKVLKESTELQHVLQVSPSKIWPACHIKLEENNSPKKTIDIIENPQTLSEFIWGCELEAYAKSEHGEHLFAYELKGEDRLRASDQRLTAYDAQGKLLWSHTIDRDSDPMNFKSSRRSSFILDFDPYLVCGGTRWDGSLEYACIKKENGEVAWQGKLASWSGTNPVEHQKSLTFGDISSLKKIYPWEGVERQSIALKGTGGYSSLYITDGNIYMFSANRAPWKMLTAYDLKDMTPIWSLDFDISFDPLWSHAYAKHNLTILRHKEHLLGIRTSDGTPLWNIEVGPDVPPITLSEDTLFLLARREDGPNLLHALDPQTGEQRWYASVPTGTLDIRHENKTLLLKSIRSVQRAWIDK